MSNWLEEVETSATTKPANDFEQISNAIYNLLNSCSKIESLTKQMERDSYNPKKFEVTRKKMKKEREMAKESFKKLTEDFQSLVVSDKLKDKQVLDKLKKNLKDVSIRFEHANQKSFDKEREIELKGRDGVCTQRGTPLKIESRVKSMSASESASSSPKSQKQLLESKEDDEPKFVLMEYTQNTINTVDALAKEKLNDLRALEEDMDQLHECFTDLRDLLKNQQEDLNLVEANVDRSNALVEEGVEDLVFARKNATLLESFQGMFSFI